MWFLKEPSMEYLFHGNIFWAYQAPLEHSFKFSWPQPSSTPVTTGWPRLRQFWAASCRCWCCTYTKAGAGVCVCKDADSALGHAESVWEGKVNFLWAPWGGNQGVIPAPCFFEQTRFIQLFELPNRIQLPTPLKASRFRTRLALARHRSMMGPALCSGSLVSGSQ